MAEAVVFVDLQSELEKAKENLKFVDENIKKLTGRDPSEFRQGPFQGRQRNIGQSGNDRNGTGRIGGFSSGLRRGDGPGDGPPLKRRALPLFGRGGLREGGLRRQREEDSGDDDDLPTKPTVQSSVVANPKEQKTRKDCIDEQKSDTRGMARNRRMFGLLLGTLQKFRVEEQQKKGKEQKRIEIEKKLDDMAEREKEDLKKERKELFLERRKRQAELRRLEYKMELVRQLEEWERHHKQLSSFIRTKAEPHIHYLPAKHNDVSKQRLAESQELVNAHLATLRATVEEEISIIGKRKELVVVENEEEEEMGTKNQEQMEAVPEEALAGLSESYVENYGDAETPAAVAMAAVEQELASEVYDDAKENFPVLIGDDYPEGGELGATPSVVEAKVPSPKAEPVTKGEGEEAMQPGGDDGIASAKLSSPKESGEEKYLDADAIDPNKLTEKEFEPIYD